MDAQRRLLFEIIAWSFGPDVAAVAGAIFKRSRSNINQIGRSTSLSSLVVRTALVVLLQHRIVTHYTETERGRKVTYYSLTLRSVLSRLRFPRYVQAARSAFGDEGKQIASVLLLYGRLTIEQTIALIDQSSYDAASIRDAFLRMCVARYIVHCDSNSSMTSGDVELAKDTVALNALGVLPKAKDLKNMTAARASEMHAVQKNMTVLGLKRKQGPGADLLSKTHRAYEVNSDAYFAINIKQFDALLKDMQIAEYANDRISPTAGKLLRCALSLQRQFTISQESGGADVFVQTHPLITVHAVRSTLKAGPIPMDHVIYQADDNEKIRDYLELAVREGILERDSEKEAWLCSEKSVTLAAVRWIAESLVRQRYGRLTFRVFRAALLRGKIEEKAVPTICMMSQNEARRACQMLHISGFFTLDIVPRTADKAPGRCFYVYGVSIASIARMLRSEFEKSLANMLELARFHHSKAPVQLHSQLFLVPGDERANEFPDGSRALAVRELERKLNILRTAAMRIDNGLLFL